MRWNVMREGKKGQSKRCRASMHRRCERATAARAHADAHVCVPRQHCLCVTAILVLPCLVPTEARTTATPPHCPPATRRACVWFVLSVVAPNKPPKHEARDVPADVHSPPPAAGS